MDKNSRSSTQQPALKQRDEPIKTPEELHPLGLRASAVGKTEDWQFGITELNLLVTTGWWKSFGLTHRCFAGYLPAEWLFKVDYIDRVLRAKMQ